MGYGIKGYGMRLTSDPPSLGLTGLGYIFSARAANWYACNQRSLKSAGRLIHWQSEARVAYEYAVAALYSPCRKYTMLARRILKKHTQPL